jgi:hypothetical protein
MAPKHFTQTAGILEESTKDDNICTLAKTVLWINIKTKKKLKEILQK